MQPERTDVTDLREEFIVCHAAGYPDPFSPHPNTLENARRFADEHSGPRPSGTTYAPVIKRRLASPWREVARDDA